MEDDGQYYFWLGAEGEGWGGLRAKAGDEDEEAYLEEERMTELYGVDYLRRSE